MRRLISLAMAAFMLLTTAPAPRADDMAIEDFALQPETRWQFFTDDVMGGVSSGAVAFLEDGGQPFARMTGQVSTANNGGFIQMRLTLATPPPPAAQGIRLIVRGNDQRYFVHLRTTGTRLPWQYYQAGFDVTGRWTELRLPFEGFAASGALLRRTPRPDSVTSVALVAFGRDHEASIDLREIAFY